jgi:hypothetical protein
VTEFAALSMLSERVAAQAEMQAMGERYRVLAARLVVIDRETRSYWHPIPEQEGTP